MGAEDFEIVDKRAADIWLWAGAALAYFLSAVSVIYLTSSGGGIATVWPANAILVALLLAQRKARWALVLSAGFAGNLAANWITRGTLIGPVLFGIANLIEVAVAVQLIEPTCRNRTILESPAKVARFILVAGVVAPATSAGIGGLTAVVVYGQSLQTSVLTWIASDGLGLIVFTPFVFAVVKGDYVACFKQKNWARRVETVALLALLGAVSSYIFFSAPRPLLFGVFPPLMMLTFRVGRLGTKAGVMLVAVIGGSATMYGLGPVTLLASDPASQAQFFQAFLAATLLTCLPAAAEVSAKARHTAELAEHDRRMTMAALYDPLTGALNRAGLEARGREMLGTLPAISIIMIDFDHFKHINDRWGHRAGDLALKHVTSVLTSAIRSMDLVARVGGDEFVVLLPHSDLELATSIAERIQTVIRHSPLSIDNANTVLIGLSVGIASGRQGESCPDIMGRADAALYEAKNGGRGLVRRAG